MATTTNGTKKPRTPVDELTAAERELRAMKNIYAKLEELPPQARGRVLAWLNAQYEPKLGGHLEPSHERAGA